MVVSMLFACKVMCTITPRKQRTNMFQKCQMSVRRFNSIAMKRVYWTVAGAWTAEEFEGQWRVCMHSNDVYCSGLSVWTLISFSCRSHLTLISLSSHSCSRHFQIIVISLSYLTLVSISSHYHVTLSSLISLACHSHVTLYHYQIVVVSLAYHCHITQIPPLSQLTLISLASHSYIIWDSFMLWGGDVGNNTTSKQRYGSVPLISCPAMWAIARRAWRYTTSIQVVHY
jgi:hypothetical protein